MKKIMIIYTGGTIGMQQDASGALSPFDFGHVSERVPELKKLNCELHHHAFDELIDSSNVTPEFWVKLAKTIAQYYEEHDAFIILHGTDTMAYSASALSFMLENLGKPVIFTGSQLPMGEIRTDAKRNLITSVEIACGNELIPEVCIFFNNQLFRGNRSEKFTSSKFDAFQSLNHPALAESGVEVQYNSSFILPKPTGAFQVHTNLDAHIGLLRIFPGINEKWMQHYLQLPELKALVLETYGSGNAPSEDWFIKPLREAISRGLLVVNVSQCSGGRVEQGKYETSVHLGNIGVISGADLTTEAALTKLMVLFGKEISREELIASFQRSWCGELNEA